MIELVYLFIALLFIGTIAFKCYKLGTEESFFELHNTHMEEITRMQQIINFREYQIDSLSTENKILKEKIKEYENG